ncbi:alpha-glucosidase [Hamadaea flava]|uniref:Glycoside hydrolase family 13 protein n=1 Tax=Hamadaea flava TaxID=1742688 RepID=A0ABV8LLX5_9ACTN|nr:glycoside hydrolase family 13 protein [Hamadaea flava]MCP2329564.1 alpha-glucosidase [Hamadaea flava]
MSDNASDWWRNAVIYQVYPRSFADADGDGVGDLNGFRSRLPYLRDLGVDAVWFSPWYRSPMADGGYDVADHCDIDPTLGTLADAEALIQEAHAVGIKVIIDVVPNHASTDHPWFRTALAAGPGAPERDLFYFRPGLGEHGEIAPNTWVSPFAGTTWTRVPDGEWYLHLFDASQPDYNWRHPQVIEYFDDVLRFWFDRGVDGIRIDSAPLVDKDPNLPEVAAVEEHPYSDRDDAHIVYRRWRRVAEEYGGDRALIGEVWLYDPVRFANYLRPDEMHGAFNFEFLCSEWGAARLRKVIDETLAAHAEVGAAASWVLNNHDVTRVVSRFGRADTAFSVATRRHDTPVDVELGARRARAAIMLALALPGSVYLYQGEELGLTEVEDIPFELRTDPMFHRSNQVDPGRDGCRVPLPWSGDAPPFGFSAADAAPPWLPQPAAWKAYSVQAQTGDPESMLEFYRRMLRLRSASPSLGDGRMSWLPAAPEVLAFARGDDDFACVVNLGGEPVELPPHREVILASAPPAGGRLPVDTTVWLRT